MLAYIPPKNEKAWNIEPHAERSKLKEVEQCLRNLSIKIPEPGRRIQISVVSTQPKYFAMSFGPTESL
jgi:hypothetical protein